MEIFIKYLLYFIIFVKVLFLLSIIRYKITINFIKNDKKAKNILKRKEVFHEVFVFLMYIILILLFNPFQNNIKLNDDPTESKHLLIAIFALGLIELLNFDYDLILKAPIELYNSI